MNNEEKTDFLFDENSKYALSLKGVKKTYKQGTSTLNILNGVDFNIKNGEIVALVGPSGAGKSTLLHIAGLLERPDEGEVLLAGNPSFALNDKMRTKCRLEYLGFVYQYHNLLPEFSALENVMLPQLIKGVKDKNQVEQSKWLLEKLGLGHRITHRPAELSGGEQQRVAIARALSNKPRVLLADEPTGNLDPNTSKTVFMELLKLVRETGLSALIATHNPELASKMDRKVTLIEGKLINITV
ncbi:MAG: Lipoprotein-releasing system ATP-binding protein LolD [Alphaproteobacteria bacterium ADurb.Bin438]|nr:MAG: Lipoprotein-releasing system ATP-binding protein LolD [Alphaproteobacteria bacterium ADurb.Bin438]